MNKRNLILFLLAAALLMTATALLPQAAALLQDRSTQGQARYGDIQTIQLHLNASSGQSSVVRKLAMMCQPLYLIGDEQTTMTPEDVLAAIENELVPYYESGLILNDWDTAQKTLTPYLAYGGDDYCIFWEVSFTAHKSGFFLNLYMDDETGKIIFIHYSADSCLFEISAQSESLASLTSIYFDALGIVPDAEQGMDAAGEDTYLNSGAAVQYILEDPVYGRVCLCFYLHENDFYVSISC